MKYIKSRNQFLKEDLNLAKSIVNKKMVDFEKIKELLKDNVGYIGKFTEYLMNENIPFIELESLYKDLLKLKEKNHPINTYIKISGYYTSYDGTSFDGWEDLKVVEPRQKTVTVYE